MNRMKTRDPSRRSPRTRDCIHIIQQLLQGCDGTTNISDDIIVPGRSKEEHDRRLHHVLQRLEERGLTLNRRKCDFDMPKLQFTGHMISKEGLSLRNAIGKAREPTNASEVRSSRTGLVSFCTMFLPDLHQSQCGIQVGQAPSVGF